MMTLSRGGIRQRHHTASAPGSTLSSMNQILRRVWHASPHSVTAALAGRLGLARPHRVAAPRWERMIAGPLTGRELWLAREANGVWNEMIDGRFDAELYDAFSALTLRTPVIWDVGGHIGYHALGFAARDSAATVVSFEPNPANLSRLRTNLDRNADLAVRIEVLPIALADQSGELTLVASDDVDGGGSSCSFLSGSDPPLSDTAYDTFERTSVAVRTIDDLAYDGSRPAPSLIKVDVEGAELMVLRGALRTISQIAPAWLIEVHTIGLMVQIDALLHSSGYRLRLLAEHTPSRCLVLAERPVLTPGR
jgi:FkbM family methyltransferase